MPEKTEKKQSEIFWMPEESAVQDRYFFATNREDLLSILASGIISPGGGAFSPKSLPHAKLDSLVLLHGGLRQSEVEAVTGGDSKRFPVLLEYAAEPAADLSAGEPEGIRNVSGARSLNSFHVAWFPGDDELEDFRIREFESSPVDVLALKSDPQIFSQEGDSRYAGVELSDRESAEANSLAAAVANSLMGAVASTLSKFQAQHEHFRIATELLGADGESVGDDCRSIADRLSCFAAYALNGKLLPSEFEAKCFVLAAQACFEIRDSRGIDADTYLKEFQTLLGREPLSKDEQYILDSWAEFFGQLIRNEKTLTSRALSDEKNITLRGVLLFVFFPDLKSLLHVRDTELSPGHQVFSIATQLIGIRRGYLGLPADRKTDQGRYAFYSRLGTSLHDSIASRSYRELAAEITEIETRPSGDIGTEYILRESDGLTLLRVREDGPVKLLRAYEWIRKLNYEFTYIREEERFELDVKLSDDRRQKVLIGAVPGDQKYQKIRIWSPCVNLKEIDRRRISKKYLLDLLMRSYRESLYCHFAMPDKDTLVASTTLIEGTLDQSEFDHAVLSVASEADEQERRFGEEDRF